MIADEDRSERLFLALRPPAGTITRIAEECAALRVGTGIVPDDRLHVTLAMIGDFPSLPSMLVDRIRNVAATIARPAFHVLFDWLSFAEDRVMLTEIETSPGLEAFRLHLRGRLLGAAIPPWPGWRYRAHVTLAYGRRPGASTQIEAIRWPVDEFVLIHSSLGEGRHEVIGRWQLA